MADLYKTLRLNDLLNVDAGRLERSKGIKIEKVRCRNTTKKVEVTLPDKTKEIRRVLYRCVYYNVKSDSGSKYKVIFMVSPGVGWAGSNVGNNVVRIYCNCPDFMYRAAWLLNQTKNLYHTIRIDKTLRMAIDQKPTRGMSNVCKHVLACVRDLKAHLIDYGLTAVQGSKSQSKPSPAKSLLNDEQYLVNVLAQKK